MRIILSSGAIVGFPSANRGKATSFPGPSGHHSGDKSFQSGQSEARAPSCGNAPQIIATDTDVKCPAILLPSEATINRLLTKSLSLNVGPPGVLPKNEKLKTISLSNLSFRQASA